MLTQAREATANLGRVGVSGLATPLRGLRIAPCAASFPTAREAFWPLRRLHTVNRNSWPSENSLP